MVLHLKYSFETEINQSQGSDITPFPTKVYPIIKKL